MHKSYKAGSSNLHNHHRSPEEEDNAFNARIGKKGVTIETSEMVDHGEMKGGSRIMYPTLNTWQKQQHCIHKLKVLSQKHVTESKVHDACETPLPIKTNESSIVQQDFQPRDGGEVPGIISSDEEASVLSQTYETFSAAAGLRSRHSHGHDKKPMPIYQFIADLIQHASKSVACVRSMNPMSACAAVGGNGKYQYHPYDSYRLHGGHPHDHLRRHGDVWDDFDASTFDSIMSGNKSKNNHIGMTTESCNEEHSTLDSAFDDPFGASYT